MSRYLSFALALTGVLSSAVLVSAGAVGCQSNSNSTDSEGGSGGSGGSTTTTSQGGNGTTTSQGGNGTGGDGTGGAADCNPATHTIEDITTNVVGPKVPVSLHGVVAMSTPFLVFDSDTSCLWGVFVSAPGISETAENSGLLVTSYGDAPTTGTDGKLHCPTLGVLPTGSLIPDSTVPGDVLDVVGETAYFMPQTCGQNPGETSVPQFQLGANKKACAITKTGTAAVPAPHKLTGADIDALAAPDDTAFHDKWGGVKVQIAGTAVLQDMNCAAAAPCLVNKYGEMKLDNGLVIKDKLYYRGQLKADNLCHDGPKFSDAADLAFTAIAGFSTLDYCTWLLNPADKCADLTPQSSDCTAATCPPTVP